MDENRKMVKILDKDTVEVSLPNKCGHERIAMESSASFAKIVGFKQERIEDLKTAVSEACLNAIEHGNRGRPDARVVVTMSFKENIFSVSVRDEGEGMSEGISEPGEKPDIEKKIENSERPRGLGIFLIKELMDQVEFNKMTSEGHEVSMVLKLGE